MAVKDFYFSANLNIACYFAYVHNVFMFLSLIFLTLTMMKTLNNQYIIYTCLM